MKKNNVCGRSVPINFDAFFRVMKLCLLFAIILNFSSIAATNAQLKRVSLNMENAELRQVFRKLKQQTGIRFFYNEEKLKQAGNRQVDIHDLELDKALEEILEGTELTYTFLRDVVVIKERSPETGSVEALLQEKRVIRGVVKDENGATLPGVSVIVKGTQAGVATDIDGRFEIRVDQDPNVMLQFSFVGMEMQEVKVGNREQLEIVLKPDAKVLDEVVCTGFQTISRERATGSFQIVSSDELKIIPAQDLGAKLEGLTTGMQVEYNEQTGATDITIRGIATMNADAKPLIVVDGFPVEGDFSTINPNDIEHVTVLKDAAAASIWGARAGNGVVVVTTKSGRKSEKPRVSIDAFVKISPKIDLGYNFPIADSETQIALEKFEMDNGFGSGWGYADTFNEIWMAYTLGAQLMYDRTRGLISETDYNTQVARLKNTSNKKQIEKYMLNNPVSQNYNMAVNGGGKIHYYNLSAMYSSDENNIQGNKREKLLINFKNTFELAEWLNFDFALTSEMRKDKTGLSFEDVTQLSPYELLKNEDGSYAPVIKGYNQRIMNNFLAETEGVPYNNLDYNPLQDLEANDFTTKQMNMRFQTGLAVKFLEGLEYRGSFQYERFKTNEDKHYGEDSYYVRELADANVKYNEEDKKIEIAYMPEGDILASTELLTQNYNLRNQVTFNRTFAEKHSVSVLLGSELIWTETTGTGNTLYGYDAEKNTHVTPFYGYGSSTVKWQNIFDTYYAGSLPTGHNLKYTANRFLSFYGNATYMFNEKYSISGSIRNDASNIIVDDPKYRYSPFWSVGLGWNLSNEAFFDKVDFLDRLALRATYGKNGNTVSTASSVPIISWSASPSPVTGELYGTISDKGNPALRWEKIEQTNIGVDFSFWHKISGSIDYYNKKSKDLMARIALAPTLGSTSQNLNAAAVRNNGIELDLNYSQRIIGDFKWNTGIKVSYNKSEVTDFKQSLISPRSLTDYRFVEGFAVDPVFSYIYGGMSEEGKPRILSSHSDQEYTMEENIGSNGEKGEEVLRYHGSYTPKTVLGWTNTFTYKGITLRALITGKFGHKFRRPTYAYGDGFDYKNHHKDLKEIMGGRAQEIGLPEIPAEYSNFYYRYSWYVPYLNTLVENASHIRLREIYLGYEFPKHICDRLKVGGIRVYSQIRNLGLIWAANGQGIDPDYISGSVIKPEASFTFGLNVNF